MADETFRCIEDYTATVAVAASCGCCCDTAVAYFDAGECYVFDVGRYQGEIVSATHNRGFNSFDVPEADFKAKFRAET